ncbi:MAG: DUF1232 domain-containing protein [Chroococcidiopsidaceae cyanobacterium CP_BM_ER_R8_30]|nr:DUF1232 domain-containing protein [Chroococcidiopsidaceae cyanobacterium CP_BM_ER_R8_30]
MKFPLQTVYNWYRNLIRNPKYRWWVVLGTLLYFISPLDIVSDFIPFIGELDDAVLMTLLVSEVSQFVIEGFKGRRGTQDKAPDAESHAAASTVDVEAVSVK